jgi:opacity protein-like surface antigen
MEPCNWISSRASFCLMLIAMLGLASPARAQKWELEFVGGGVFPSSGNGGTTALPPENSTLSGGPPGFQTARIVSSWYFGDGASQLNRAIASQLALFRVNPSIVPLDTVLESRFAERQSGPTVGFRVSRLLSPRFSAEFTLESVHARLGLDSNSISGLEASRLSFINAWNGFLTASGTQTVTSIATTDDNRGRQLVSTGTLLVNLATRRRLTPYAVVGGGLVSNGDRNPSAQLVGRYHFVFAGPPGFPVPSLNIDETDTVALQTEFDSTFAFVIGGGVKYAMNARFSLRLDVRDLIYDDSQRTMLDATPMTVPNSSGGLISGTTPMIAFGSSPIVRSTLSGGAISRFETFRATGTIHQVHATGGITWRF